MPKFILPHPSKGTEVINDRYVFVDGVMQASNADAEQLESILVRFYGCTMQADAPQPKAPDVKASSIKAAATKAPESK